MTITADAVSTEMIEMTRGESGKWVKLAEIAERLGVAPADLRDAVIELLQDDDFRASSEQLRCERAGVIIGGEPIELVAWFW